MQQDQGGKERVSLGLSGACEVLSQQGTAVADIQDLGLLLPDQPWSWRAWPSRDPGQSLGPGLGTHGGQWGPLLMCPRTLSDPNNGDGQWPGQARVPTEPLPEPRTWGWE